MQLNSVIHGELITAHMAHVLLMSRHGDAVAMEVLVAR
jgi:hypothetical protein